MFFNILEYTKIRKGTSITKKRTIPGKYPVIAGGEKPAYYHNQYNRDRNCITISSSGNAGYVSYHERQIFASDCFTVETTSEGLHQKYLYYYLKSKQDYIYSLRTNAAQPHIYPSNFVNFQIFIPALEKQLEIVENLDNLTNWNGKLKTELEYEIDARQEQYDWYLNQLLSFQSKLTKGNKIRENRRGGRTDQNTYRVKLGKIAKLLNGYAFKPQHYTESGIRILRITNVADGEINGRNTKFTNKLLEADHMKYSVTEGDILISLTGNVGKVGRMTKELTPAYLNQRVCKVVPCSETINASYFFWQLNSRDFEQACIDNSTGILQKNLSTRWIEQYEVPLPNLGVQHKIVSILDEYAKQLRNLQDELANEIKARQEQFEHHQGQLLKF